MFQIIWKGDIMAQSTRRAPSATEQRMAQAQQIMVQQLQARGYTRQEANEIFRLANQMVGTGGRRARNPTLDQRNPAQRRITASDLNHARDALMALARRPREPARGIMMDSASLYRGPERQVAIPPETRPAPVRTHVYVVTMGDQQYRVQLRHALPRGAGLTSLRGGRVSALRDTLFRNTADVMAITLPNGTTARPGSPQFNQFVRSYDATFRSMLAEGDRGRITVEAIKPG